MAKETTKKADLPKPGQLVRVRAHADGYRCAGIAHTKAGIDHPRDAFTPAQLEVLNADPRIFVSYVDASKAAED
jgi:hypothetical protein